MYVPVPIHTKTMNLNFAPTPPAFLFWLSIQFICTVIITENQAVPFPAKVCWTTLLGVQLSFTLPGFS